MTASLDKTANARMVNTAHPLVSEFSEFCQVLSKLAEVRVTQRELAVGYTQLEDHLKIAAKSLVGKTFDLSRRAGAATRPLAEAVGGKTFGRVIEKGIHVAPAIGAAVAAHNVKERIDNSPGLVASTLRAAGHQVARQTPGTQAHQERLWEIQNGR